MEDPRLQTKLLMDVLEEVKKLGVEIDQNEIEQIIAVVIKKATNSIDSEASWVLIDPEGPQNATYTGSRQILLNIPMAFAAGKLAISGLTMTPAVAGFLVTAIAIIALVKAVDSSKKRLGEEAALVLLGLSEFLKSEVKIEILLDAVNRWRAERSLPPTTLGRLEIILRDLMKNKIVEIKQSKGCVCLVDEIWIK